MTATKMKAMFLRYSLHLSPETCKSMSDSAIGSWTLCDMKLLNFANTRLEHDTTFQRCHAYASNEVCKQAHLGTRFSSKVGGALQKCQGDCLC